MKRIICGLVAAVLLIGVLLGCGPAAPAGPVELTAVAWLGLGRTLTIHAETTLVDLVAEKSNGELVLNFLGGSEVVPKPEQPAAARDGVIDIAFTTGGEAWYVVPEYAAVHLSPFAPWEERTNGIFDYWVNTSKPYNLYWLGRWSYDLNYILHFGKDVKVEKLADMKGLKITPLGRLDPLVDAVGATVVEIGMSEMYEALNTGLVDGFMHSDVGAFGGWEEVIGSILDQSLSSAATFIAIMNLDKWNSLSRRQKDALTEAWVEFEPLAAKHFREGAIEERQKYVDAGVKYFTLPPDEAKWVAKTAADFSWEMVEGIVKDPERFAKLKETLLQQ